MKKKLRWIILICILICVLLNLNRFVQYFFVDDENKIYKICFEDYASSKSAYALLNPFEYQSDSLLENVFCSGWAFVESDGENSQKSTQIILKGNKNSYITASATQFPDDVHVTKGWKKIPGECNDFRINFSTIMLPDDSYEIYIYVEENSNTRGLINTGQGFRKKGILLMPNTIGEKVDNIPIEDISESFSKESLSIEYEEGAVKLTGWAWVEDLESEKLNYYVVCEGINGEKSTLNIPNQYRLDMISAFDNPFYTGSGVTGRFINSDLPDSVGRMYIVAESSSDKYISEPYFYNVEEKLVKKIKKNNFYQDESLTKCSLTVEKSNSFDVNGWGTIEGVPSDQVVYYMHMLGDNDKSIVKALPNIKRSDVAEYLNNPIYEYSGFSIAIDISELPDSTGYIYIVGKNEDKVYLLKSERYEVE